MSRHSRWSLLMLSLIATVAVAVPVNFGARQIDIPMPDGLVSVAAAAPKYIDIAQGFLPATNRLVDTYTSPADRTAIVQGKQIPLLRQLQLQVPRELEGKLISQEEFSEAAVAMDAEMKKAFASIQQQADTLASTGSARVKQSTGVDAKVSISDIGYHGVYRNEPWGMFFTMSTKVATRIGESEGGTALMVGAGGLLLVNHQLVYAYAYSDQRNEADVSWAKTALSDWADALHSANPDDAKLETQARRERGGFDWSRLGYFAGLGAFIAIVASFARKKQDGGRAPPRRPTR